MSRLDRFANPDGSGKYALLKLRNLRALAAQNNGHGAEVRAALQLLRDLDLLDFGENPDTQFFTIRIKDKNAAAALAAYAFAAQQNGDSELARDVHRLSILASEYPDPQMPT